MLNWFSEELKILFIEIIVHQMFCRSQGKKKGMKQQKNINHSLYVDSREKWRRLKIECPFTCKRVGVSYSGDTDWQ